MTRRSWNIYILQQVSSVNRRVSNFRLFHHHLGVSDNNYPPVLKAGQSGDLSHGVEVVLILLSLQCSFGIVFLTLSIIEKYHEISGLYISSKFSRKNDQETIQYRQNQPIGCDRHWSQKACLRLAGKKSFKSVAGKQTCRQTPSFLVNTCPSFLLYNDVWFSLQEAQHLKISARLISVGEL